MPTAESVAALAAPVLAFGGAWVGARSSRRSNEKSIEHERSAGWREACAEVLVDLRRQVRQLDRMAAMEPMFAPERLLDIAKSRAAGLLPVSTELERLTALAEPRSEQVAAIAAVRAGLDELWSSWFLCAQRMHNFAAVQAALPDDESAEPDDALAESEERLGAAQDAIWPAIDRFESAVQSAGSPR